MFTCFLRLDSLQDVFVCFSVQFNFESSLVASVLVIDLKYWQVFALELKGCENSQTVCNSDMTGWLTKPFIVASSAVVSVLRGAEVNCWGVS